MWAVAVAAWFGAGSKSKLVPPLHSYILDLFSLTDNNLSVFLILIIKNLYLTSFGILEISASNLAMNAKFYLKLFSLYLT